MGVYYMIACDELKERIEPGDVFGLGIKRGAITSVEHPIGALVINTLMGRWNGRSCRVADDCGEDPGYFEYTDVTEEVMADYNEEWPNREPMLYGSMPDRLRPPKRK